MSDEINFLTLHHSWLKYLIFSIFYGKKNRTMKFKNDNWIWIKLIFQKISVVFFSNFIIKINLTQTQSLKFNAWKLIGLCTFWIILNHSESFWIILNHFVSFRIVSKNLISSPIETCLAICQHCDCAIFRR